MYIIKMEEFSKFLKDKLGEHEPEDVNWEK